MYSKEVPVEPISFSEIYDIICLYFYSFSIDIRAYPCPDISQEQRDIFTPKHKKAIKAIYEYDNGKRYIPFNEIPLEPETDRQIIENQYSRLQDIGFRINYSYKYDTGIYTKAESRIFAFYENRRYTFNSLVKDTYDFLLRYLYLYELSNGDIKRFPDLYFANKEDVLSIFKDWCEQKKINYSNVYNSLKNCEELMGIDILGNLNKDVVLLGQNKFNFKMGLRYLFKQSLWNNMKSGYDYYLKFLDSKIYLLKLAHLDYESKENLDEAFSQMFYKYVNFGNYHDMHDKIASKYI